MPDDAQDELETWLNTQVREAMRQRALEPGNYAEYAPGGIPDPRTLINALVGVRARMDTVESILAALIRAKSRTARAAKAARYAADDAWNANSIRTRNTPGVRRDEYVGAKEHYADNNLASFNEQRQARASERLADYAAECLDVVRLVHRGLDSHRTDLNVIMRTLAFESHLERSAPDKGY